MSSPPKKVALLLHDLEEGGMQTVCLRLLNSLSQIPKIELELVLAKQTGFYISQLPPSVRVVDLNVPFELRLKCVYKLVLKLSKHLRHSQPDIILSNLPFINFVTILAKLFSQSSSVSILIEHTLPLKHFLQKQDDQRVNGQFPVITHQLVRLLYPYAHHVVAPSSGIAGELDQFIRFKAGQLKVIYNPVVDAELGERAKHEPDHPWFRAGEPPVLLAVGRLAIQKDYETLIRAFDQVSQTRDVRLMILGDGELRSQLEDLIQSLGLSANVALPGFVENPYAYMRASFAFVLSSIWEILPTVLIEALACECLVIATNCDYGPSEILDHGKYGILVPVQDPDTLAQAVETLLSTSHEQLYQQKKALKERANVFSITQSIEQYLNIMQLGGENASRWR